jgi:signal transduction histidine kinase/CheY-like chemotaxis protein
MRSRNPNPTSPKTARHYDTPQADGERLASWLRLVMALLGLFIIGAYHVYSAEESRPGLYLTAFTTMAWAALSTGYLALIHRARYAPWMSYVSVLADVVMVTVVQAVNINSLPLSFVNAPITALFFAMIGLASLRRSRRLAVFAGISSAVVHLITSGVAFLLFIPGGYLYTTVMGIPIEISFLDEVGTAVLMAVLGWIIGHVTRELRESERQYQDLFEHVPDGIVIANQAGEMLAVNKRFADMVGVPRARLAGRSMSEFLGHDNLLERNDGSEIAVRTVAAPLEYQGQDCVEMSVRDVAEQAQLEQQLVQSQKMESLGRLAGGLAHDFNNILGGVIGATSLAERTLSRLARERVRPELVACFDRIRDHGERARQVVKRLLTFSRSQEIETTPIDLDQLIDEVAGICRNTFGSEVAVVVEPAGTAAVVEADGTALTQALLNLCINAADAMGESGTITIRVIEMGPQMDLSRRFPDVEPGQLFLCIEVEDDGVGMAPEMLDLIFDPFFTTKPPGEGTGLGLSMVYNIARQHGGFVDVSSTPGRGSVFRLFLTRARDSLLPAAIGDEPLPRGTGTVLVVDDDEIVRSTIAGMLVELGYEVVTALSGRDALRRIEARPDEIDLILLDMVMPYMDGAETLKQIRRRNTRVPVIITSGFWRESRAQELEDLDVAGFLRKPFSFEKLATKVEEILAAR